jgi:hypothetical protein
MSARLHSPASLSLVGPFWRGYLAASSKPPWLLAPARIPPQPITRKGQRVDADQLAA